jgi:hypothetical protein
MRAKALSVRRSSRSFVLVFDRDDEVMQVLLTWASDRRIAAARWIARGASAAESGCPGGRTRRGAEEKRRGAEEKE